jgi:hypothetical protein
MSDATASISTFRSVGEEFCWHARNFAAMYGAEYVEMVHILLAAAEVTPVELHGYHQLTPVSISKTLATLQIGNASEGRAEPLPQKLTPGVQELVANVISFAARTKRAPSLRDIWVALSQKERGMASFVLDHLGIDRSELYRRVSGA